MANVTWNGTVRSIPAAGELNWAALSNFLIDLGQNAQTTNFQKIGMRVATTSPVTVAAASDCVIVCKLASPGAVTVNLPAGVAGQMFCIVDGTGDAATNNITIDGNSSETVNGAATYVIDGNRNGVILAYSGTEWVILAEFIASSSGDIPRAQIAAGTASYVLINDGSGNMSEEAQLAASRGGLGADASAFTGVVKANAGSFSAATIVNADVDAAAAIAHSKLANITAGQVLLGNASNVPTATALSGDVTVDSSGVTAIGSGVIVNADINASAAIADTKLGTISTAGKVSNSATTATNANTANAIVARDASGNFSAGTITATLSGNATNVSGTVAIANGGTGQTAALAAFDALAAGATGTPTKGDLIAYGTSSSVRRSVGADGQVLTADSAQASGLNWTSPLTNPMDSAGDLIVGGAAGAATKLDAGTSGHLLMANGAAAPSWVSTITGAKTFSNGILLGNAASTGTGVTSDSLTSAFYEEITLVTTVSNFSSVAPSVTIKAVRIGKMVVLHVQTALSEASKTNTSNPATANALPTSFRPQADFYSGISVRNNNIYENGTLSINTAGTIFWLRSGGGAWTSSAQANLDRASVAYTVS